MIYPIEPMGAPRMTRADAWRKRDVVLRYHAFKDAVRAAGVTIPERGSRVLFYLPMPASWSKKKKAMHNGEPHQSKPDIDNLLKALMDAAMEEDCGVWDTWVTKLWAYEGSIEVIGK